MVHQYDLRLVRLQLLSSDVESASGTAAANVSSPSAVVSAAGRSRVQGVSSVVPVPTTTASCANSLRVCDTAQLLASVRRAQQLAVILPTTKLPPSAVVRAARCHIGRRFTADNGCSLLFSIFQTNFDVCIVVMFSYCMDGAGFIICSPCL